MPHSAAPAASAGARLTALRVALVYAAAASLWILGSDWLLARLVRDPDWLMQAGALKGWGFVALTAVLAVQPRVLALDEPTTLLDLRHRDALLVRLDALPQQQIISTHDLEMAATAQRALLIHDGLLLDDGPAEEVIDRYRRCCREGFPTAPPGPGTAP